MVKSDVTPGRAPSRQSASCLPLYILAGAAVAIGVYARFKGIGAAPMAVDEYYLLRSSDNVLRHGSPAFSCGGWYTRGLILQYLIAGLRYLGLSAEVAPRLITAMSSLVALPAAYILGHRAHGRVAGLLAVTILAVSVWEVEMARFGRMYAPFQALFLWYLVFFLRYTVDREAKALWPMLALTILAPLTWEGGVFLALINLLPLFLRDPGYKWTGREWRYLALAGVLLAAAYGFTTANFRFTDVPAWPQGYESVETFAPQDVLAAFEDPMDALPSHPAWLTVLAVPVGTSFFALYWIWRRFGPGLATAGLFAAVATALLHQFAAAAAAIVLVLLFQLASWRQLFSRDALPLHVALGSSALFWVAFTLATVDWHAAPIGSTLKATFALAHQFAKFPDVADVIVRPWLGAVPMLGLGLLLALVAALVRTVTAKQAELSAERALLIVLVCLLLAVGVGHPPRHETRYVFFLYPVGLIVAIGTLAHGLERIAKLRAFIPLALALTALGAFALSEDFQPEHLVHIDDPAVIFRADMSPDQASHLVTRADSRTIAQWLRAHATQPDDLVISGYHSLDYYYPKISYFFTDWRDRNFAELSCLRGTVDRWSNRPLLYTAEALRKTVRTGNRAFVVMFADRVNEIMPSVADLHPIVTLSTQNVSIVKLRRQAPSLTSRRPPPEQHS